MKAPVAETVVNLSRMLPIIREMLEYAACQAVLRNDLDYDGLTDTLTYHHRINEIDEEMFTYLRGAIDVWVITQGRRES